MSVEKRTLLIDPDGEVARWECSYCGGHNVEEIVLCQKHKRVKEFCPRHGDIFYDDPEITEIKMEIYVCKKCGARIAESFDKLIDIFDPI